MEYNEKTENNGSAELPKPVNEYNGSAGKPELSDDQDSPSKLRGYKIVCAKLGLAMCVYFLCRLLAGWFSLLFENLSGTMGESLHGLISSAIIILLVYVIPLLVTALIFNSFANYKGKYRELYKKPKRLARALGTFPATYGFGYGIALLTLLVMCLISRNFSGHSYLEDLLQPTALDPSTNIVSILTLVFMMVVIAPVFEEIWVRGIMYDALKPYGTGMAIIVSSIIFGFMHGSLYMLFYTTALGFVFGYIRYATNSLYTVTVLHAMVNSIAAGVLLLSSLMQITNEENRFLNTIFIIYIVAVLILIIVGIVVFFTKIPAMRKYKIENSWTEISPWKKTALFFVSVPVILMMVLVFNELSQGLLVGLIFR